MWKQVKIASNGWAMEEAQSLCGERLYQDLPCWEIALVGFAVASPGAALKRMKKAMMAHPRSRAGSFPQARGAGAEGEEKPF